MFPQGWDIDGDCPEPVIEIFPEVPIPEHLLQIAVGGRNDLDVQGNFFRASEGTNALILKNAQKFDLGFERDFGNFIQKDGPCISRPEKARGFVYGAGKSTFFVSEQFAFKEFFGNSTAIHGHKGIRGATAFVVDVLSDQVFSGTAFSCDQHASRPFGSHLHLAIDFPNLRAFTYYKVVFDFRINRIH